MDQRVILITLRLHVIRIIVAQLTTHWQTAQPNFSNLVFLRYYVLLTIRYLCMYKYIVSTIHETYLCKKYQNLKNLILFNFLNL